MSNADQFLSVSHASDHVTSLPGAALDVIERWWDAGSVILSFLPVNGYLALRQASKTTNVSVCGWLSEAATEEFLRTGLSPQHEDASGFYIIDRTPASERILRRLRISWPKDAERKVNIASRVFTELAARADCPIFWPKWCPFFRVFSTWAGQGNVPTSALELPSTETPTLVAFAQSCYYVLPPRDDPKGFIEGRRTLPDFVGVKSRGAYRGQVHKWQFVEASIHDIADQVSTGPIKDCDIDRHCSSVTLAGLSLCRSLGNNVGIGCSVTVVRLVGLTALTSIGNSFFETSSICELVIEGLTKLETIGTRFCRGCANLHSVSIGSMISCEQLIHVGDEFLFDCKQLECLDLTDAPIEAVGSHFAAHNSNLSTVRLPPTLEHIGNEFLSHSGVQWLDLSSTKVSHIPDAGFMKGCLGLRHVWLRKHARVAFPDDIPSCIHIKRSGRQSKLSKSMKRNGSSDTNNSSLAADGERSPDPAAMISPGSAFGKACFRD